MKDIGETVREYETFINETLKKRLEQVLNNRDSVYESISECIKLRNQIEGFDGGSLTTMVDLGSNFYAQAKVSSTKFIYVNVGFGFFAQLTKEEAIDFLGKKEKALEKKADGMTAEAAKIKADIKVVLSTIQEVS
ncbi:Prefoldin alpha-like protein [Cladochytrium replicatum]|nr:Prefoldin alpha-like protein [Cladochytrium replicatum]